MVGEPIELSTPNREAIASLTMLIGWTIWNERNARVFRNKSTPPPILFNNIKNEAITWVTAVAKKLGTVMPGGYHPFVLVGFVYSELYALLTN